MSGNQFADVVQKGLAYLLTRPSSEWEASQLSWALNCLSKTGLPKEQQFIARCLRQLLDRCNPDGTWTSEDGPVFAVGATIEALKVLYHYGLI